MAVVSLLAIAATDAGASTVCAAGTCTVSFQATGAPQIWEVPAGVSHVTLTVEGAGGGGQTVNNESLGGRGGRVSASLSVAAGESLTMIVGAGGENTANGQPGGEGGYGGGGEGGDGVGSEGSGGAGGGGGSFVFSNSSLLLAAGGGGGGGAALNVGGSGGAVGAEGMGNGVSGGAGATGSSSGVGGPNAHSGGGPTTSTVIAGVGGAGGTQIAERSRAGGGGGGGYYGGGGGGAEAPSSNGGGGGGSDFVAGSAADVSYGDGEGGSGGGQGFGVEHPRPAGDGSITVSYPEVVAEPKTGPEKEATKPNPATSAVPPLGSSMTTGPVAPVPTLPSFRLITNGAQPSINARHLTARALCMHAPCLLSASATVKLPGIAHRLRLGATRASAAAGQVVRLSLSMSKRSLQTVRNYLREHRTHTIQVDLTLGLIVSGKLSHQKTSVLALWTLAHSR